MVERFYKLFGEVAKIPEGVDSGSGIFRWWNEMFEHRYTTPPLQEAPETYWKCTVRIMNQHNAQCVDVVKCKDQHNAQCVDRVKRRNQHLVQCVDSVDCWNQHNVQCVGSVTEINQHFVRGVDNINL